MRLTRRSVLVALPLAATCEAAELPTTLYVTPDGRGDGASWATAAGLYGIGALLPRVAPGGQILIAADGGPYQLNDEMQIRSGGSRDGAISIRGVNRATGAPQLATLRGAPDQEGFRLLRGARYLNFSHLAFENFGNGCFRIGGPVSDLKIEDCTFDRVYRFLENTASGEEASASLARFEVRRCRGTGATRGFSRVRYSSIGGLFEDCFARGVPTSDDNFPAGCVLEDDAGQIVYRRCVMEGFQQVRPSATYWNGDGFSDESENFSVRYELCQARGQTDGGFDCKSADVVLDRCVSEDNKRNFRVWSPHATLTGCISRAPHFRGAGIEDADSCHVWIGGERGPVVRMTNFTVEDRDSTAIFSIEDETARIELQGLTVQSPHTNWGDGRVRRVAGPLTFVTPR